MIVASTFLSHSSSDKPLVEAVARELGRRGVLVWLDKDELDIGLDLSTTLSEAVKRQVTLTVFLSEKAVGSTWVRDELVYALDAFGEENILPVYIGDPMVLVTAHPLLHSRWLHPDGDRVKMLGIVVGGDDDPAATAKMIAEKVAIRIYRALKFREQPEVVICLDQRGGGRRGADLPPLPENIRTLSAPALIFQPDRGGRSDDETLHGPAWEQVSRMMLNAIGEALGTPRWPEPRKIRLCGDAQLGLFYLLGRYFDRSTSVHLFCCNNKDAGRVFNNKDQMRLGPLEGGNTNCEALHEKINSFPAGLRQESVALLLSTETYVGPVVEYLDARGDSLPLIWVKSGRFERNDQVMSYIADVVALLKRLRDAHATRTIYLFTSLPNHVLPLLAANLLHVIESVLFMEYRRDLQGKNPHVEETYVMLEFP